MAVTLAQVKLYLRIDIDDEDELLGQCMKGAEAYLVNAIDNFSEHCKRDDFEEAADILRLAVISEMYTNRESMDEKGQTFPYFIRSMITQLQNYVPPGAP
ncbi:head-tail connector protein [uncultured Selenomonas sp.]|uniref:head-tail connector protein n=1 Tax=uncultured Selenomonas sp. TaxID=159275 RepID=UPI0028D5E771|nr:head-tail connector protein [uncultured Selenomonas sp.]